MLAVTGAEALYADMGHFGRALIRLAWLDLMLPGLVLNYFGQGALVLRDSAALEHPFYHLVPGWALWPLIGLAVHPPRRRGRRTERVDEMRAMDLTSTLTGEGQASIFVTVDHASTECRASTLPMREALQALEPLRQAVRFAFGAFGQDIASGLKLRHDHGSQFVADDFQRELAFLGIASSPAFVREPEGNGCVERFIRTLKEDLLWVRRFDTIEELRQALHAFKETYNRTWIVERHRYQTPAAVRAVQLAPLPAAA